VEAAGDAGDADESQTPDPAPDLDLTDRPRPTFGFSTCEWDVETSAANQATHIAICDGGRDVVSGGCKMTNNNAARLLHSTAVESNGTDLEDGDTQNSGDRWRCTYADGTGVIQVTMLCCSP
jgi:hypothetical protein